LNLLALYISDIDRVCTTFGWNPIIGVKEGLKEVIEWVMDHDSILSDLVGV